MEIREMRATFGKLQDRTLKLQPGLNCIYAPNESGKSTWSHFLRIMLYGLNTRDRGPLADKNRFAPWCGAAMRGQLHVTDSNNTALTLSRDTRRVNTPMGQFSCTYTGTADAVPGIDSQNAGEVLLGVPREVFERSAFIHQTALAVDSDVELERRIAALITTGDEDVSYTEVWERLKKQLNRRKSNRTTGQIPALEQEITRLESQKAQREELSRQAEEAHQQAEALARQMEELQTQQALWQQVTRQQAVQQYAKAKADAEKAEDHAAQLLTQWRESLPDDALLSRMEGQCAALVEGQSSLCQAQAAAQRSRLDAEEAKGRYSAHPLYPSDAATCQAQLAATTAPNALPRFIPIIGAVLAAICAVLAVWFAPQGTPLQWCLWGGTAGALIFAAVTLLLRRRALAAQTHAEAQRIALQNQIDEYLPLLQQQTAAAEAAAQATAAAECLSRMHQQQLLMLLSSLQPYAPTGDLAGAQAALARLRRQRTELSAARQTAREAAMRRDLLAQQLPEGPMPDANTPPLQPAVSREQVAILLPQVTAALQSARSRLDTLTGQLRSLDSDGDMDAQLQQLRQRLTQLQEEYDAVALAMAVLDEANTTLQNRFSPALGARAAEIFTRLTRGRYQKVLLRRDFALETDSDGAQRSVQLLSQGAADQLYLAVRLAICDMVLPEEKRVPLILDDALTSFDDDRLHAALDYLVEESRKRQILLFTCQKREGEYLQGRENVSLLSL